MRYGIDYVALSPMQAKAQGVSFVMRYLSNGDAKDLTKQEALELADLGIDVVVMWESTGNRALDGELAGEQDASAALAMAISCGMVGARPIYFTVDFDTTPDPPAVGPYFRGVVRTLGVGRTGAYGGVTTIRYLFDSKLISWGWQTSAWSYGAWDARAQIHQVEYDSGYDRDVGLATDFGQWRPGVGPPHPRKADPEAVLLPAERIAVDRYHLLAKHAWAHKAELAALRARLTTMRKAIWWAANLDGLTAAAWAKYHREARYLIIEKLVPVR